MKDADKTEDDYITQIKKSNQYRSKMHLISDDEQKAMENALRIELDKKAYAELKQLHDLVCKIKIKVLHNRIYELHQDDSKTDLFETFEQVQTEIIDLLASHRQQASDYGLYLGNCEDEFPSYDYNGRAIDENLNTMKKIVPSKPILLENKK